MGWFKRLRSRASPKVAVIGLDGVPCGMVEALTRAGVMPNLGRLCERATLAPMRSTIPTISSISWTGFMTGNNPGRHGIYGFTEVKPDSYGIFFNNYRHVRCDAIWDILASAGKRCLALNIPNTYPAKEISGVMISGFVAINLERAVTPRSLLDFLRQNSYQIDVNYINANKRPEEFFADLGATLEARKNVYKVLLAQEPWDLFIGVVTETDRLHHYFFDHYVDEDAKHHARFIDFYRALDRVLGELLAAIPSDATLFVISDHGHTLIESEFYPNVWLKRQGLLRFATESPKSVAQLDPSSEVFVLDPGRVYVNTKGRFASGVVEPGAQAEELLAKVAEGLSQVAHPSSSRNGESRPVKAALRREELYHGPCLAQAPDMVLHFNDGFDIKGAVARPEVFGRSQLTGMHTYDDSLLLVNRRGLDLRDAAITDLAPTILGLLGVEGGEGLDGRRLF